MKNLFLIFILAFSSYSFAAPPTYKVYRINGQVIMVPDEPKKELKGTGVTFNNTINFETSKDPQGVETKKAWLWIGGCGKTYIENDQKIFDLKQGTRVRVRMSGKCSISSWELF